MTASEEEMAMVHRGSFGDANFLSDLVGNDNFQWLMEEAASHLRKAADKVLCAFPHWASKPDR